MVTSVLHELPPPRTGRSGRPRTKGTRLGTPTDLAATATWHPTQIRRYGRTDTVHIAEVICVWYGSCHRRTIRVILVRDDKPPTPDRDDRGYALPSVSTDLESTTEDLVARYAPPLENRADIRRRPSSPRKSARPAIAYAVLWNAPCPSA